MLSKTALIACLDNDIAQEENLAVYCERCGSKVDPSIIEQVWSQQDIDYVCPQCGKVTNLTLRELDKFADTITFSTVNVRALQH